MEILLQQLHKMGVNMCVSLCEVVGNITLPLAFGILSEIWATPRL